MQIPRSPRFKRIPTVAPIQLTERDRDIIQLIHRHRFLRSNQIMALMGGSEQQITRRLQLLYHHGYLERPRAQIQYYERGGSRTIAYGLGNKGGVLLRRELGVIVDSDAWSEKNNAVGRVYLEHTLFVSEVMVSFERACRNRGIRLLYEDQLEQKSFRWKVTIVDGTKLGVVPDRVFALEYADHAGEVQRTYFFLEADRGTMPVIRNGLAQTSFFRKLLAYEASWGNKIHQRHLDIPRFRVLTIATTAARVTSLLQACSKLKRGHGLFLFTHHTALSSGVFLPIWKTTKQVKPMTLLS